MRHRKTARFSAPLDTVSAGQQREMLDPENILWFEEPLMNSVSSHLLRTDVFIWEARLYPHSGKVGFWNENHTIEEWMRAYSLINVNWFSFTRKRNDSAETSRLVLFQSLRSLFETKEDRYPSHRPNDHGDKAGLYLEDTRGPLKRQNNGYVSIRWRH